MILAQISDIHARNNIRIEEFRELSSKCVKLLKKHKPDRILVLGDVFDQKTTLSPESVGNILKFFADLRTIAPVDLIAGNHDLNMGNKSRESSLEPIVWALHNLSDDENPEAKLKYYKKSGLYHKDNNLVYGIFEIRDSPENWPVDFKGEEGKYYVALHHGTINGCKTDLGQIMDSPNNISLFKNYDLALLGDIHLRQFLNKEKTIGYCGSLFQNNFGESGEKGFLLWDTETSSSQFIPIPNDYNFVTVNTESLLTLPEQISGNINPHTKLRIQCESYLSKSEMEEIKISLSEKYKLEELPIINSGINQLEKTHLELKENWTNYTDPAEQRRLISDWLKEKNKGDDTISEVLEIHEKCKEKLHIGEYKNNIWELKKVSIDNIGVYGEGNILDTNKLKGVIGIFSKNKRGKTTLIDAISLALYGESIKDQLLDDCLNFLKKQGSVSLEIQLNGILWKVTRILKRSKPGSTSQKLKLEKWNGHSWIDESKDDVKLTNKEIISLFGTKEDLLATAIANQEDVLGLVKGKETIRLAAFYRFSNISFFENLYDIAKNDVKDYKGQLNIVQNQNSSEIYKRKETLAQECEGKIKILEGCLELSSQKILDKEDEISKNKSELIKIPEDVSNIDRIKNDIFDCTENLNSKTTSLSQAKFLFDSRNSEIKNIRENLKERLGEKKSIEVIAYLPKIKEFETEKILISKQQSEIKSQVASIQKEIQHATKDISQLERQIQILTKQDWHETNQDCRRCLFLSDAWTAKDKLIPLKEEIPILEEKLPILQDTYEELEEKMQLTIQQLREIGYTSQEILEIQADKNKYDNLKSQIETDKEKVSTIEEQIKLLEVQLENLQLELAKYENIEQQLAFNLQIERTIKRLISEKDMLKVEKREIEKSIFGKKSEQARYEGEMENILENLQTISKLERSISNYDLYMQCVDNKGLPLVIIDSLIPKINAEVNTILSSVQDWRINIIINDNSKLLINFIDTIDGEEIERKIETCSGAEKALTAISLRVALTKISCIQKSDFLVFDESFSSLDIDNIGLLKSFLLSIKKDFNFIILISHLQEMRDICDDTINIEREGNGFASLIA